MALPPTAAGAAALAATARKAMPFNSRQIARRPAAPMEAGQGGPSGDAARNAIAGLKGFKLATGSPSTASKVGRMPPGGMSQRPGDTFETMKSRLPGGGASGGFMSPDKGDADAAAARTMPGPMIQGREVNPDGTITGRGGNIQQLGEAARQRLGMPGGGGDPAGGRGFVPPDADSGGAPMGLKGFRMAMPEAGVDARPDLAGALDAYERGPQTGGAGGGVFQPMPSDEMPQPPTAMRRRMLPPGGGGIGTF